MLEHHAHSVSTKLNQLSFTHRHYIVSINPYATFGWFNETGYAPDQRGLTAAGQAHNDEGFPLLDLKGNIFDCNDMAGALLYLRARERRVKILKNFLRIRPKDLPKTTAGDLRLGLVLTHLGIGMIRSEPGQSRNLLCHMNDRFSVCIIRSACVFEYAKEDHHRSRFRMHEQELPTPTTMTNPSSIGS